jgi:hypothetical protein
MDNDERTALLCAEKANYFSAAMKLLFKCCRIALSSEKEHVINSGNCEEYENLLSYEEDFNSENVDTFYPNFAYFISENPGIFTIMGNDEWLKNEEVIINICDGRPLADENPDSTIHIGSIYTMASNISSSEARRETPVPDLVRLRNYIRLSLIMACESISYGDEKRNFSAIASIIRNDLSISDKDDGKDGNNMLAPIMGALKGIMSGIIPETANIPTPTMKDMYGLSGELVSGLTKHGSNLRSAIMGLKNIITEENGDITGILRSMAEKTNDPEVKNGISSIAGSVMSNFGGLIPESADGSDPISRALLNVINPGGTSSSSSPNGTSSNDAAS